jgi:hypothetical protein
MPAAGGRLGCVRACANHACQRSHVKHGVGRENEQQRGHSVCALHTMHTDAGVTRCGWWSSSCNAHLCLKVAHKLLRLVLVELAWAAAPALAAPRRLDVHSVARGAVQEACGEAASAAGRQDGWGVQ